VTIVSDPALAPGSVIAALPFASIVTAPAPGFAPAIV
jgi:hypothetical protein